MLLYCNPKIHLSFFSSCVISSICTEISSLVYTLYRSRHKQRCFYVYWTVIDRSICSSCVRWSRLRSTCRGAATARRSRTPSRTCATGSASTRRSASRRRPLLRVPAARVQWTERCRRRVRVRLVRQEETSWVLTADREHTARCSQYSSLRGSVRVN